MCLLCLYVSAYSPREAKYTRCRASSILKPAPFITSVAATTGCSSGTDSQDPGLTDGHSRNMANNITLHKTNNDLDNIMYLKLIQTTLFDDKLFGTMPTRSLSPYIYILTLKLLVVKIPPSSRDF